MTLTAFLSYSFSEEDNEIKNFFYQLLEEHNINVLTGEPEDATTISGKIYPKIDKSDFVVGVFTSRYSTDSGYMPPPAVISELSYAKGKNKPIYGFREKEVNLNSLGLLAHEGLNLPTFTRDNLSQERTKCKQYIEHLNILKQKGLRENFKYSIYSKDVTVYSNGYGVIRFRCKILTKSETFRSVLHYFALGDSAIKDLKIPSRDKLNSNNITSRWQNEPFLNFKLINSHDTQINESDIDINFLKYTEEDFKFHIRFPKIDKNQYITYEWAVGFPNLFPVNSKDLEHGKRKADRDHALSTIPNIINKCDVLNFIVRFEGFPKFIDIPSIRVYDNTNELVKNLDFDQQISSIYSVYVVNFIGGVDLPGGHIVAQWKPI